jgi:NTE family protein
MRPLPCFLAAVLGALALLAPAVQAAEPAPPKVTVVLAGGGAKGFAHIAVLRRLEQDRIPIAKIIGTSMGAVIGSLYATGMSTQDIEKVIGSLDPGRIALDQIDRTELPHRTREYQQRYTIELELGVKNGALTFARGVSDGQRFLTLMQELTASVPPNSSFDALPIPFRAVATRYRDGEMVSFDRGTLALVVRASMAAPGAFAPVEIEGETYVDGGLVANLPVEVALREGADVIVASYLGDTDKTGDNQDAGNALSVATRMLDILVRQNERRNIALLRPHDILVRPQLQNFNFGSFRQPAEIIQVGSDAVIVQDNRFRALAQHYAPKAATAQVAEEQVATALARPLKPYLPSTVLVSRIRVTGNQDVPSAFIERELQDMVGQPYQPQQVAEKVDALYASGNFERLSYQMAELEDGRFELVVDVNEKTYGPNFLKTSMGFYSESSGTNLFSLGVGFRRPWLTADGLELQADVRGGSQAELALRVFRPLGNRWGMGGFASYTSSDLSLYRPDVTVAQKMATATLRRQELGLNLSYDLSKRSTATLGLINNQTRVDIGTAKDIIYTRDDGSAVRYTLQDGQWEFTGLNARFVADLLDSPSFPTQGHYINIEMAKGVTGTSQYNSLRANASWASSWGPHVVNLGVDLGADQFLGCGNCSGLTPLAPLFLGGFQSMGAYQMGQLIGDRMVHAQATYMYRLSDGGILHQPTFVGLVAEAGDAWNSAKEIDTKQSGTVFIGVDSKIGDVFFGIASGSGGNRNIFLQLGRRFSAW